MSSAPKYPEHSPFDRRWFRSSRLRKWGVPANAIVIEPKSLNTYQNAINTKQLADNHGLDSVLLVTSARHMPRALATFRKVGINAIPSPTDYLIVNRKNLAVEDLLPNAGALWGTTAALREYLGFLTYRWRGWI